MKKLITLLAVFFCLNSNAQIITTVAGTGVAGYSGDGGQATTALLNNPTNVVSDAAGNLYIAEWSNNIVRKVSPSGIISTYAGNASAGFSGDGGLATAAQLFQPEGVALDASGNLYIADRVNNVIRMVNSAGIISTIAGTPHSAGNGGDGGQATAAQLVGPTSVAVDVFGNIIIGDADNNTVRRISTAGIISTIAGTGTQGYAGDGGQATAAFLNQPYGVGADMAGNVYIADFGNAVIRKVNYSSGIISTIAGNGTSGYSGDGGQATAASLYGSSGVAIDAMGNLFIADDGNHVVRLVNTTGVIITYAGNGTAGYSGDGGPATSAQLNYDFDVWVDGSDNLFIADFGNNVVRKIIISQSAQSGQSPINSPTIVGAGNDVVLFAGGTNRFEAQLGAISYLWSPATGLSNNTISNPFVTVDTTTTYTVRIETSSGTNYYTVRAIVVPPAPTSAASCTNWVPNGDFETHLGCTHDFSNLVSQTNWGNAGGTCDFYTACNTTDNFTAWWGQTYHFNYVTYPTNSCGTQNSSQYGNSYAGLILTSFQSQFPYFEYTQTQLPCSLITGQTYKMQFDASWAANSNFNCGNIGMLVSTNPLSPSPSGQIVGQTPQVDGACGSNANWTTFSSTYVGAGEQWVTIGDFDVNAASQDICNRVANNNLPEPPPLAFTGTVNPVMDYTYNYLDNVIIAPIPPDLSATYSVNCAGLGTPPTNPNNLLTETGSPGNLCSWYGPGGAFLGTGASIQITTPNVPGTYIYTVSVDLSSQCSICTTPLTNTISIQVLPLTPGATITPTVTPGQVCANYHTGVGTVNGHIVNPTSGTSYIWDPVLLSPNANNTSGHLTLPPGIYTVNVSTSNCSGLGTTTFTINPFPVFPLTTSTTSICYGVNTATLTAFDPSNTYTFTWTPPNGLSTTTGSVVVANPPASSIYATPHVYTVHAINSFGCISTETISVASAKPPTDHITVLGSTGTHCSDNPPTYTISPYYGGGTGATYQWSTGQTTETIVVQPPVGVTTYTLIETTAASCAVQDIVTYTVIPTPTVSIIPSSTSVCTGTSPTLTAISTPTNSTTFYTWANWNSHNNPFTQPNPFNANVTNYTYTVTAHTNGCAATATVNVIFNPLPPKPAVSGSFCSGVTSVLTVTNNTAGETYSWTAPTGSGGVSCNDSPYCDQETIYNAIAGSTYTVVGTDANGCISPPLTIHPNIAPNITIHQDNLGIDCANNPLTYSLEALPLNGYTFIWDNGSTNQVIYATPTVTTTYTVVGTSTLTGCSNQTVHTINVMPNPSFSLTANTPCAYGSLLITPSSNISSPPAPSYTWFGFGLNGGNNHGSVLSIGIGATPVTYSVTGIQGGCRGDTVSITVTPFPRPVITAVANPNPVCPGSSATLTASGGLTYTWGPTNPDPTLSSNFGSSVVATPTVYPYTSYVVSGTDVNGCVGSSGINVNLLQSPYVAISGVNHICSGHSATLTATTVGVTGSLNWVSSDGLSFSGNPVVVTPSVTTTYTATGVSANGCAGQAVFTLTVYPIPTLTVTASSNTVCAGSSVTFTATGANGGYSWYGFGVVGNHLNIVTTPTLSTNETYTVYGSVAGCAATPVTINILVIPTTTLSISEMPTPPTICLQNPGAYVTLTANSNAANYQWLPLLSLSCPTCASTIATPSVTTTYTVTTSSVCNSATQTITVSVENCFCNNGTTLPSSVTIVDNTTFASAVTFGVNQNLTVAPSSVVTLTNKELYFAPTYTLTVPTGSTLILDHCHLLTCADMWQGIIVAPGASLKIKNNCMIEDAFEAINCSSWNQSATSNTLSVDGCVFNKNQTGININNYNFPQSFPATIRRAVFTSRTLPTTANSTNWSTAAIPTSLTQTVTGVPALQTPYRIANTVAYAPTKLNAPMQAYFPSYGIYLNNVGYCTANGTALPAPSVLGGTFPSATFNDLTIGDGTNTSYLNMFDELYYGIYATTANFTCVNNIFEALPTLGKCVGCPKTLSLSGTAIYAVNAQTVNQIYTRAQVIYPGYTQTGQPKIGVVGMPAHNNKFYDCVRGTEIINYTEVDISGADIRSTQVAPANFLQQKGSYGFVVSTPIAINVLINSNKITNINNGINFNLTVVPTSTSVPLGEFLANAYINYNIISANLGNPPTTQFINNAIVCDNLLNCYSNSSPSVCYRSYILHIDSNTIENAYRGIEASNWVQNFKWPPEINYNYITVVQNNFNPSMTHFGINATTNLGIKIYDNTILGPSINNLNIKGIYQLDNMAGTGCNSVYNVGKGFEYEGPGAYSFPLNAFVNGWANNIMNTNQYGFCLTNNGVIGPQSGLNSSGGVLFARPSDNQWQGTWTFGVNSGTFVDANSPATLSPLYVRSNSLPYYPPFNNSTPAGLDYVTVGALTVLTATNAVATCTPSPQPACINCRLTNGQSTQSTPQTYLQLCEKIALDSISYVAIQAQNNFRSQQKLFRMMQMDSTIGDSSIILQNFYNATLSTNVNTFGNIESAILNGDYATAQSLNGSVTPNSLIESNHKLVYDAIIKNTDSTFSSTDSLNLITLASSCPAINGDAVYQARILYNNIYNSYQYFENNCNYDSVYQTATSARKAASIANNITQQNNSYLIYPNPTTGRVYISGANGNDKELSIDILDITGRSMLKQTLSLNNGIAQLQTNLPNGVYMIQIKGSDGKVVVQRLIVSN